MVPLRIECHLIDEVVSYHDLHLDSVLSYAVAEEQTQGAMLDGQTDYIHVPIPLAVLWRHSRTNAPLYASTNLATIDAPVSSIRYWHKRALEPTMTMRSLNTSKGSHKEKRVPMPTIVNRILYADAIGNPQEIARLLSALTAIGKKRVGVVYQWKVYRLNTFSLLDVNQCVRRPVPVSYALEAFGKYPLNDIQSIGYSPPYWHPVTRDLCLPAGTCVL